MRTRGGTLSGDVGGKVQLEGRGLGSGTRCLALGVDGRGLAREGPLCRMTRCRSSEAADGPEWGPRGCSRMLPLPAQLFFSVSVSIPLPPLPALRHSPPLSTPDHHGHPASCIQPAQLDHHDWYCRRPSRLLWPSRDVISAAGIQCLQSPRRGGSPLIRLWPVSSSTQNPMMGGRWIAARPISGRKASWRVRPQPFAVWSWRTKQSRPGGPPISAELGRRKILRGWTRDRQIRKGNALS